MSEAVYLALSIGGLVLIVVGFAMRFYFMHVAMQCRRELWRREDARAAGTVPYDADGYEDWSLPIPAIPNVRRYVERRERPRPLKD